MKLNLELDALSLKYIYTSLFSFYYFFSFSVLDFLVLFTTHENPDKGN